MKLLNKLGVLILVLMIVSCAATKPSIPEVKLPPERILLKGYSVMPLNETGWLIAGRNEYQFALAKYGMNPDETFALQGMISKIPAFNTNAEFLQVVRDGQAKDTDPKRFKITKHEVTLLPMAGVVCAKSHLITEDHAAVKRSNDSRDMILEALTLSCAHPSDKNFGIHVTYSHRHYPGNEDAAFVETGMSVLNSVELFAPDKPYFSSAQKSNFESANKFSTFCSGIIAQSSQQSAETIKDNDPNPQAKLSSLGISINRKSSVNQLGSYALFEKGKDGVYTLAAIESSYIEPKDLEKQEVLFISTGLDKIAPAFATHHFNDGRQAFVCETGAKFVTGIDSKYRSAYNPCDSALTTASNFGSAIVANTLLTVISLGANVVTGSTVRYVDTDKDKVAKLAVNSNLYRCLKEANLSGLKNEIAALAAKSTATNLEAASAANKAEEK